MALVMRAACSERLFSGGFVSLLCSQWWLHLLVRAGRAVMPASADVAPVGASLSLRHVALILSGVHISSLSLPRCALQWPRLPQGIHLTYCWIVTHGLGSSVAAFKSQAGQATSASSVKS